MTIQRDDPERRPGSASILRMSVPELAQWSSVVHAFTGDCGPWETSIQRKMAFWNELAGPFGFEEPHVARLHQVHGAGVVEVNSGGDSGEGDALICREPGVLLAIRTADCVPILVSNGSEVAAIHAGWRGLVAGVIEATLRQMVANECVAVVGPCIAVEKYEVGEEVVNAVADCGVPQSVFLRRDLGAKPHVSLRAAAAWKLQQWGVQTAHLDHCTWSDSRFPSYRRNGPLSGRMISMIGLKC